MADVKSTAMREPVVRIVKRDHMHPVHRILVRVIAIALALVVDALFIYFVTKLNPLDVYKVMFGGTFGNKMRLDYFWGTDPTGSVWTAWGEKKPDLAAGTYYLKAEAAGTKNWNATNAVARFCVWTNPADVFTDFVDFTFTGDLKDKTVEFTVSEAQIASGAVTGGIPGFEHARAGVLDAAGTASELRFVCTNAVKMADELLAYTFVSWNKSGVSTVRVKLPRLFPNGGSIRMYWHAAEGEAAMFAAAAAAAKAGSDATAQMQAKFGRAKNLGARSIGPIDAGSASNADIWQCFCL